MRPFVRILVLASAATTQCSSGEEPCTSCPDASSDAPGVDSPAFDVRADGPGLLDGGDAGDTGTPAWPVDGYGVYEACDTMYESMCLPRLTTIRDGGFALVLNYAIMFGSATNVLDYLGAAQSAGVKVIAAMNSSVLRQLGQPASSLPYSQLLASCGSTCTTVASFVDWFVNLVKGSPALWGYYVGDEIDTSTAGVLTTWKAYTAAVHSADPSHPRLVVEGTQDGLLTNTQIPAIAPFVEVIAQDFYPIGDQGLVDAGHTGAIASGVRADALDAGAGWGMVLQAASWQSYAPPVCNPDASVGCVARCSPFPACAPFPSEVDMQSMRDQVIGLGAPRPRLVLWYSYFDVLRAPGDGGAAAWAALTTALAAP